MPISSDLNGRLAIAKINLQGRRTKIAGIVIDLEDESVAGFPALRPVFTLSIGRQSGVPCLANQLQLEYFDGFSFDTLRNDPVLRQYLETYAIFCESENEPFCDYLAINVAWRMFRDKIKIRDTLPSVLFMTILEVKNDLLLAVLESYRGFPHPPLSEF